MNKLSVMLWLSDVVPGFRVFFAFTGAMLMVASTFATALCIVAYNVGDSGDREGARNFIPALRITWPVAIFLIIFAILLPSKQTMLAITASEAAESLAVSPQGKEIMNDTLTVIRQWIKSQIREGK